MKLNTADMKCEFLVNIGSSKIFSVPFRGITNHLGDVANHCFIGTRSREIPREKKNPNAEAIANISDKKEICDTLKPRISVSGRCGT